MFCLYEQRCWKLKVLNKFNMAHCHDILYSLRQRYIWELLQKNTGIQCLATTGSGKFKHDSAFNWEIYSLSSLCQTCNSSWSFISRAFISLKIKLCLKNYSRFNIVYFFVCYLECVVFLNMWSLVEHATKKLSFPSVLFFIVGVSNMVVFRMPEPL